MKTTPEIQQTAGSRRSPASCSASLRVPRKRPAKWAPGDIAIDYITLRQDHDPKPPCLLAMVISVDGNMVTLESLDSNDPIRKPANQLLGVQEALDYFDRCAEDLTVKSARIGRRKLELLAEPFAPFPDWLVAFEWWEKHPEDRPDGYEVMRRFIPLNDEVTESPLGAGQAATGDTKL